MQSICGDQGNYDTISPYPPSKAQSIYLYVRTKMHALQDRLSIIRNGNVARHVAENAEFKLNTCNYCHSRCQVFSARFSAAVAELSFYEIRLEMFA